jgi:hypothetical protein
MFGGFVNEPLEGVNFPGCLLTLAFGCEVNQPLLCVTFPVSLLTSMFGSFMEVNSISCCWA